MKKILPLMLLLWLPLTAVCQQTTGLFQYDWPTEEGYVLWGPIFSHNQYVMNNCGEVVHTWSSDSVTLGNSFYLLEDGTMLRCAKADTAQNSPIGGGGGSERIQKVDWDGNVIWDFIYYDNEKRLHHDIAPLPNGNVLAVAWVIKDQPACVQAGRDPNNITYGRLFNERLIEVEPTGPTSGNIVWEWNLWDHLVQDIDSTVDNFGVVADHPELLDINWLNQNMAVPGQSDFVHMNAIDYNADLDQILMSSQIFSEIWIIDHSTTTSEAAGHTAGTYGQGGDFLYRWGNPQVYGRGTAADQKLWRQHDANWIADSLIDGGDIMVFNNGLDRPTSFSEVDVIEPPQTGPGIYPLGQGEAFGPETTSWNYHAPDSTSFYSFFISGARRQPNGNTIICEGETGHMFEVTYDGEKVWDYVNPVSNQGILGSSDTIPMAGGGSFHGNLVFRANRYPSDYSGFDGHDLSSGATIESDPVITNCTVGVEEMRSPQTFNVYPNPSSGNIFVSGLNGGQCSIYSTAGQLMYRRVISSDGQAIDVSGFVSGLYLVTVSLKGELFSTRLVVQ